MLLGCLKTLQRPYQILDWYWVLAFLWQNNNIAKCADGRDGKPHSKGSKFLVSKCLHCFSPDWLEKPPHSSHFPKCYWKRHQKPFVRQMSCRSWEKVAVTVSWSNLLYQWRILRAECVSKYQAKLYVMSFTQNTSHIILSHYNITYINHYNCQPSLTSKYMQKKTCNLSGFSPKVSSKSDNFSKIYDVFNLYHFFYSLLCILYRGRNRFRDV